MKLDRKQLLELLIKQNYVSKEDVNAIIAKDPNIDVIDTLLDNKTLTLDLIGQAIAEYYKIPYYDLNTNPPAPEMVLEIPEEEARKGRVVLVEKTKEQITIATDEPFEKEAEITALKTKFGVKKVILKYSLKDDIDNLLSNYRKPLETRVKKLIESNAKIAPEVFTEIIEEALDFMSSDVHMEPREKEVMLRFRIDGVLREAGRFPKDIYENILNRIKILSGLRIDQHFAAQDGAIRLETKTKVIDLRVSVVPTLDGQKVVIRILSDYIKNFSLEDLGLSAEDKNLVVTASKKTFGMILTTGPTGSGKTTTLYSLIKLKHTPEVNITTIEDPVEYKIVGVNQIQVNPETDLTFAKGLRSIVRQDPNIILVGEIRDSETAEIAVNAALTGHLLLSTFHANDAATAIPRLLDMGIEPFLLASTLNLIIAQRLTRKICDSCRYSVTPTLKELKELMPNPEKYFTEKKITLYKGKGCDKCNGTGYKGRVGIYELIYITPKIQELIMKNASSYEINQAAINEGANNFFDDGIRKVKSGMISLEELIRVAPQSIVNNDIYAKK